MKHLDFTADIERAIRVFATDGFTSITKLTLRSSYGALTFFPFRRSLQSSSEANHFDKLQVFASESYRAGR